MNGFAVVTLLER